jgi:hypothetical protein
MVRLVVISSVPRIISRLDGNTLLTVFEADCGGDGGGVYLVCARRLDLLMEPSNCYHLYLFAVDEENSIPGVWILQRTPGHPGDAFRLVTTCEVVLFRFPLPPQYNFMSSLRKWTSVDSFKNIPDHIPWSDQPHPYSHRNGWRHLLDFGGSYSEDAGLAGCTARSE